MPANTNTKGYLPIELAQVALCPLSFTPIRLIDHILYKHPEQNRRLLQKDKALESLLVGEAIDVWRQYKYWDHNENRKVGHVHINAPFGMAPEDFDIIVGLYNHARDLDRAGQFPDDSQLQFRLADIARICHMPYGGGKQGLYLRSRLFRLGFVSLHFTASKDVEEGIHVQRTFKFFTIKSLSRLNVPKQKITIQLDPSFLDLVRSKRVIQFDRTFYDSLTAKHKRHYLQCVRFGWLTRVSPPDLTANDYACNQIWFADHDEQKRRSGGVVEAGNDRTHQRLGWLEELMTEAEKKYEYVQPTKKGGWKGEYLKRVAASGSGSVWYIRWANGIRIKSRRQRQSSSTLSDDPLWQELRTVKDDQGKSLNPAGYRDWVDKYGGSHIRKHAEVIRWMIDNRMPFKKSPLQALANRVHNNHPLPDGFRQRQTKLKQTEINR
ncbi:MAG: hypothetical protein AAF497_07850, partial [Planctomycetota bacterium]